MHFKTIILFLTAMISQNLFAHTRDSISEGLIGTPQDIGDFKRDIMNSNVVYVGDSHAISGIIGGDTLEVFRNTLIPSLWVLGFNDYYLEILPYFKSEIFGPIYESLYSEDSKQIERQDYIVEGAEFSKNPETGKKLVRDLIDRKAKIYGTGYGFYGDDNEVPTGVIFSTIGDRAVEGVEHAFDKYADSLKVVLEGGGLHNDVNSKDKFYANFTAGDRIKKVSSSIVYLTVDIIAFSFLDRDLSKYSKLIQDDQNEINQTYLSVLGAKEKQAREAKKPSLVRVPQNSKTKNFCDYVIFVP